MNQSEQAALENIHTDAVTDTTTCAAEKCSAGTATLSGTNTRKPAES